MGKNLYFVGKYEVEGVVNYATVQEAVDFLNQYTILGLDIETSRHPELGHQETDIYKGGLDPYLSRVIMLQIGNLGRQYAFDVRDFTNQELQPLIDFLHWNSKVLFVGHNLKFEGKHLRHNYGIRLLEVYDTMLAELSLYNGITEGLGLADLASKYLGVMKKNNVLTLFDVHKKVVTLDDKLLMKNPLDDDKSSIITPFEVEISAEMDKSIRLQFIKLTDEPFTPEQLIYGIEDVTYPLQIKEHQDKGHTILGFHFYNKNNIRLESMYTQVGADMELNGLPFSQDIWKGYHVKNKEKYDLRLSYLNNYIINFIPRFKVETLFGAECSVDWKSPKQVVELFKYLKACPLEKSKQTKQMEYSVSSKALLPTLPNNYKDDYGRDKDQAIVDTDTLKLAYLLLKKSQMNITTYGEDFLKYVHPITGRLHPNYRLHLISSRTATTRPNLLAIPGSHRGAFTTEGTDNVLVVNDYSSQESRNIASLSEDQLLLDFFNKGHELYGSDFHSYTSGMVHAVRNPDSKLIIVPKERADGSKHPDFTPEMGKMRQDIKSVNFGLAYGITAIALSKQLGISLDEAFDLVEGYFETFFDLHKFIENSKADAIAKGYVLFEPKMKAVFIQRNYHEIQAKGEECKSYFFNDYYKDLNPDQRAEYKANLYRDKPHIKEWFSEVGVMNSRLGNRGCNLKIQGVSAKQSKVAQINIRKYSVENPDLKWEMCLLLHDEVVSETPEVVGEQVAKKQGEFMEKAATFFCPNVKFETSGGASKVWDH